MMDSTTCSASRVAIIVLNWNGWKETLRSVRSLQALDYPCYDILIVDNGSTDGSADLLRQHLPAIELLELDENLGFAGGMNRGIERALRRDPDFVLLLNNDTVVAPNALTRLVLAAARHPEIGLLGAELRFQAAPERQEPTVTGFRWLRGATQLGYAVPGNADAMPVDLVAACALLARREVIARGGLMDERYFLYFEDLDWALRVRRLGFGCALVPGAVVWHGGSASARGASSAPRPLFYYYHTRNNILFVRAHGSRLARLSCVPFVVGRTLWTAARVIGGRLLLGRPNAAPRLWALAAGLADGWRGRWGASPRFGPSQSVPIESRRRSRGPATTCASDLHPLRAGESTERVRDVP